MFKLYLDPGHGGSDAGAVGNGIMEKNVALSIAVLIRDILESEYQDVSIRMSRTGDTFRSLSQRTKEANAWGAHYFMSIHINSGGGTGFETFVYRGSGKPVTTYQSYIHDEILKVIELRDRGKKQANFHVIRESRMPSILTESGFIDSASDSAKMKDPNWIHDVARAHVVGLEKAFSLRKKNNNTLVVQEQEEEEEMFVPSNNDLRDAVSVMLLRLSEEKVHGDQAIDPEWRDKFNRGELSVSDGLALIYLATYRGTFDKRDGRD